MKAQPLRLGFLALARTTFDTDLAAHMAQRAQAALHSIGETFAYPIPLSQPEDVDAALADLPTDLDALIALQATFADSSLVVRLAERIESPLLLWAVRESRTGGRLRLNSLCGINLAAHALKLREIPFGWVYGDSEDENVLARIRAWARAGRARHLLRRQTLGVIGEPPAGFDSCYLDATLLAQTLGVRVVGVRLAEVFAQAQAHIDRGDVTLLRRSLAATVPNLDVLDAAATDKTLGTYLALRQTAEANGCAALAVRCWPEFFTQFGGAACGALSLLNTDGLPCGCEADANGALSQLVLQAISDEPAFGFDLVDVDPSGDTAVVWHCGQAPLTMADPARPILGEIHSNRKLPLLMAFPLKPGRVTLARLSRHNGGLRLVVGGGEVLTAPPSFSGTSGVLRFDCPAREVLARILDEGLEHHLALAYGDHIQSLHDLAQMWRLPVLTLC